MSIFAFATTSGFGTSSTFKVFCEEPYQATFSFGYPFRMSYFPFKVPKECKQLIDLDTKTVVLPYNFASNPEFFVATGVLSFLYCVGILGVYIFCNKMYTDNQATPIVDLGASSVLALFWFAGSSAWAQGVRDVKYYTDPNIFTKLLDICKVASCASESVGNFATLNVSLILGFANFLLWVAGCWFVYKETSFHVQHPPPAGVGSVPQYPPVNSQYPPQSPPPVQSPTFGTQYWVGPTLLRDWADILFLSFLFCVAEKTAAPVNNWGRGKNVGYRLLLTNSYACRLRHGWYHSRQQLNWSRPYLRETSRSTSETYSDKAVAEKKLSTAAGLWTESSQSVAVPQLELARDWTRVKTVTFLLFRGFHKSGNCNATHSKIPLFREGVNEIRAWTQKTGPRTRFNSRFIRRFLQTRRCDWCADL